MFVNINKLYKKRIKNQNTKKRNNKRKPQSFSDWGKVKGRYLLSHEVANVLPWARDGLTARFGMELGVSRHGIITPKSSLNTT